MEGKILQKNIAETMLQAYVEEMKMEELSEATVEKYENDIRQWLRVSAERIQKMDLIRYKEDMCRIYKAASVNSKLISVNRYLKWLDYPELTVKTTKLQHKTGLENTLTKECYMKMISYARDTNKAKMYCIMKTIAQTGIRIGELKFVTVEAVRDGTTVVWNKGKFRNVYFTERLCWELQKYCRTYNIKSGIIFYGREAGKVITANTVWKNLKYIARQVNVPETMAYPHSFRHLFAKQYMKQIGDISELADLLGHSRLETTWIYTRTTAEEKRKQLEALEL